jgi:hypothetical protein
VGLSVYARAGDPAAPRSVSVSDLVATVANVRDSGGIRVSVGEVLDVLGGSVLLVPESTIGALTREARAAFADAAEHATGAIVFIVPDAAFTADF